MQVPPFSVVRPLDCSSLTEVEAYLLEFIPLHRRAAAQAAATAQVQAAATAQAQAQAQLQAATAVPGWPGAPGAGGGGLLQHYAAALQPAGAKRRPGRPRIYPVGQKPPKKQKGGAAAAAAAAAATTAAAADSSGAAPAEASAAAFALPTLFSLPVICGASGAAAGDAGVGGALALAGSAGGGAPKQRARRLTLAEAAFIGDLEQRRQVRAAGGRSAVRQTRLSSVNARVTPWLQLQSQVCLHRLSLPPRAIEQRKQAALATCGLLKPQYVWHQAA